MRIKQKTFFLCAAAAIFFGCVISVHAAANGTDAERHLAHRLRQIARGVLGGDQKPTEAQLNVACQLLSSAAELDVKNTQLQRMWFEAAAMKGDTHAQIQALRRYLAVVTADDAAQLQLIKLLAEKAQTVEDRLEIYKRFINGKHSKRLSPSLRSRVAWWAAELHRQQHSLRPFLGRLKQAIKLDETNVEACMAAYQFLRNRKAGRVDQAQALFNLLSADPTNASIYAEAGSMLVNCGQYAQAIRWFAAANRLWTQSPPSPEQLLKTSTEWAMALWALGQTDHALRLIESLRPAPSKPDAPPGDLPVGLKGIMVMLYEHKGQTQQADLAFDSLINALQAKAERDPQNADYLVDLVWAHLLFNRKIERVESTIKRLGRILKDDDPTMLRLRGWYLMRQGKTKQAQPLLKAAGDKDARCLFALGLIDKGPDDQQRRIERFKQVYRNDPGSMIGILAMWEMIKLKAKPQLAGECVTVGRLAQQVPLQFRRLGSESVRFVVLRATEQASQVDFNQPIVLKLKMINVSSIPLGLGGGGPLPSTAIVLPTVFDSNNKSVALTGQVVDIGRRLRLKAGEAVTVMYRADSSALGEYLEQHSSDDLKIQFTVIVDPRMSATGKLIPGLFGARSVSKPVTRRGFKADKNKIDQLISQLADGSAVSVRAAILLIQAAGALDKDQSALADKISDAIIKSYADWPTAAKAVIVSHLPRTSDTNRRFDSIVGLAVQSDQPLLQYAVLLRHVKSADDPILTAALRRKNGPIHRLATNLRKIIQQKQPPKNRNKHKMPGPKTQNGT